MIILVMAIGGYYIKAIDGYSIKVNGGYFINGYWWLFY
jgi:hypothetical protein